MKIMYFGGYRGERNLGDEAMAINIFDAIKSKHNNLSITVMINSNGKHLPYSGIDYVGTFFSPGEKLILKLSQLTVVKTVNNICAFYKVLRISLATYIYKKKFNSFMLHDSEIETINAIVKSDYIIIGGGGTINDIATITGVYATFLLCIVAFIFKKKIIVTGQGIGPLNKPTNRLLIKEAFKHVNSIAVRDPINSGKLLLALGVDKNKIYMTGDDACSLNCVGNEELNNIFVAEDINNNEFKIGVSVRDTNYTSNYSLVETLRLAHVLDCLIVEYNATIVFIPTLYNDRFDDRDAAFQIYKKMINKKRVTIIANEYNSMQIKTVIGAMNIVISLTYHPLVFALSQGVPAFGIYNNQYYKSKVTGLLDWFGQVDSAIELDSLEITELKKRINIYISKSEPCKKSLVDKAIDMNNRIYDFIHASIQ